MLRGKFKRGSVLLMVIGLLMIIAMLGSMLLLVARLDKQTSQAIATVAPETHVAEGILDRLLANRLADLYIGASGGPYGDLDPNNDPNDYVAEWQMIDYPDSNAYDPNKYDQALACIEPTNGMWLHVTHLTGTALPREPNDVPISDTNLVDTDGNDPNDALLFPTGILDREGGTFWAAVRMIDATGLLNVNIANSQPRTAQAGQVMGPGCLVLEGLQLSSTTATNVVTERNKATYDLGDMLALCWLDPNKEPNTVNGRLAEVVTTAGGDFIVTRGSLTTVSSCTALSPLWIWSSIYVPGVLPTSGLKMDPNDTSDLNLYKQGMYNAFLALLLGNDNRDPNQQLRKAVQLTVNFIDYLDTDSNVTRIDARDLDSNFPGDPNFYGVERHPFVSKVFRLKTYDPSVIIPEPNVRNIAAFELINPYVEGIKLDNYKIQGGTLWADKFIPGNGGRFVVYSDATIQIDSNVDSNSRLPWPGYDANSPVKIMWAHPSGSFEICVDEVPRVDVNTPTLTEPNYWHVKFRDDRLPNAHYSLAYYEDSNASDMDPNCDYTNPAPIDPNKMGQRNLLYDPPGVPTEGIPVYVRNGPLISLGDMMRVLIFGPSDTDPLTARLTGPKPTELWLVPHATNVPDDPNIAQPALPAGCVLSEFFDLLPADANNNIHGRININTAPASVLKCLPGLSAATISDTDRQALAEEIIAYRDKLNMSPGGRNYTHRGTDPPGGPIAIAKLREQTGFACAGEVAIPLRRAMEPDALNLTFPLSNNPPDHYVVGEPQPSDDGLPTGAGLAVTDDLVKKYVLYTWLANQVTVRSNTYIAYIRVQRSGDPASRQYRSYVAVIDRSNCASADKRPRVLLFTELR